jgi:hypothetical protein
MGKQDRYSAFSPSTNPFKVQLLMCEASLYLTDLQVGSYHQQGTKPKVSQMERYPK